VKSMGVSLGIVIEAVVSLQHFRPEWVVLCAIDRAVLRLIRQLPIGRSGVSVYRVVHTERVNQIQVDYEAAIRSKVWSAQRHHELKTVAIHLIGKIA